MQLVTIRTGCGFIVVTGRKVKTELLAILIFKFLELVLQSNSTKDLYRAQLSLAFIFSLKIFVIGIGSLNHQRHHGILREWLNAR